MVTKQNGTTIEGTGPMGQYTIKVKLPKSLSEPKRNWLTKALKRLRPI